MELVRAWGLEADVRAHSAGVDWHMLGSRDARRRRRRLAAHRRLPRPRAEPNAQPDGARLHRPGRRGAVAARAPARLAAQASSSTQLTGLFADADGVRANLRDVRTGVARTVHARYTVAGDGAHRAVRSALGIRMIGPDKLMEGMTTLFHAPLWEVAGEHRHPIYSITTPQVPSVLIPTGPSDRWLFGGFDDAARDDARTIELIRLAAGVPDLPVRLGRSRRFSAGAQLAERWSLGGVFLAGDAAHRVTPRGGTGPQPRAARRLRPRLEARLGAARLGSARAAGQLRGRTRPVVEYTAARSADPGGSIRPVETEVGVDIGGRIAHAWEESAPRSICSDQGSTLFCPARTAARSRLRPDWRDPRL